MIIRWRFCSHIVHVTYINFKELEHNFEIVCLCGVSGDVIVMEKSRLFYFV